MGVVQGDGDDLIREVVMQRNGEGINVRFYVWVEETTP